MATIPLTIPDALIPEITRIAQSEGFPTAKAWVIHWVREKIKAHRGNKAVIGVREAAEAQADQAVAGIT